MNEKSSKSKEPSAAELDPEAANSVFDFLYYDTARISAFLAQFDPSGLLTQITTTERAHRGKKDSVATLAAGTAGIVKGSVTDTADTTSEYGQQRNRTYDTRWANALGFLDYVDQKSLLRRNLDTSAIGDIVLFSGRLALFDLGMLKKVWDMPAIKKVIIAGAAGPQPVPEASNRQERRRQARSGSMTTKEVASEAELALEMLSVLPHSIQAAVSNDISVWCTLREDSITITPSDLFMKHGMSIGDDWNIVGILDAVPDVDVNMNDGTPFEAAKQILAGASLGAMALMLGPSLAPAIRAMLGRPPDAYGFTPLLIFRQVSKTRTS